MNSKLNNLSTPTWINRRTHFEFTKKPPPGRRRPQRLEFQPQSNSKKNITLKFPQVGGALNALNFKSDMLGPDLTMIGPGAGKIETGYSLFADMLYLNKGQEYPFNNGVMLSGEGQAVAGRAGMKMGASA
jgi:hypothetical protein